MISFFILGLKIFIQEILNITKRISKDILFYFYFKKAYRRNFIYKKSNVTILTNLLVNVILIKHLIAKLFI